MAEFISSTGCNVQLSRPQMVNIPERYVPPPNEDEHQLTSEERQRRLEMSEKYRKMVAAQRSVFYLQQFSIVRCRQLATNKEGKRGEVKELRGKSRTWEGKQRKDVEALLLITIGQC